jgi:hypothetical protein
MVHACFCFAKTHTSAILIAYSSPSTSLQPQHPAQMLDFGPYSLIPFRPPWDADTCSYYCAWCVSPCACARALGSALIYIVRLQSRRAKNGISFIPTPNPFTTHPTRCPSHLPPARHSLCCSAGTRTAGCAPTSKPGPGAIKKSAIPPRFWHFSSLGCCQGAVWSCRQGLCGAATAAEPSTHPPTSANPTS